LIYTTHIKKVFTKLHSFTLIRKILTNNNTVGQKFRRSQKFRLTPDSKIWNRKGVGVWKSVSDHLCFAEKMSGLTTSSACEVVSYSFRLKNLLGSAVCIPKCR